MIRPAHSIARRLIAIVLLVEFGSAVAATGITVLRERHVRFRALEATIRGRADALLGAVQDADDPDDNVMLDGTQNSLPQSDLYEVFADEGRLLGRSKNWPEPPVDSPDGFSELRLNGHRYRLLSLHGIRTVDPGHADGGKHRPVHILYASSEDHVRHEVLEAVGFSAAASFALLLITGALLWHLTRRELTPLRELAAQASLVSVDAWEFSPSQRVLATTELAPLANALRTVLAGLEASFTQQERFVSDAAHELKTATAVVKSSLQLLSLRPRTVEEYAVGIERGERDCERMEELVMRMLALARAGAAIDRPAPSATHDLARSLRSVVQQFAPIAELHRVPLDCTFTGEAVPVLLEAEDLRLLGSNLVLNAIQHSPPGAAVEVMVSLDDGHPELSVRDYGEGIASEALPHVFERFFRGDSSRSRDTGGAGLGLAICKAIVDRIQGEIHIASQPGMGTTVTVRFPRSSPARISALQAS